MSCLAVNALFQIVQVIDERLKTLLKTERIVICRNTATMQQEVPVRKRLQTLHSSNSLLDPVEVNKLWNSENNAFYQRIRPEIWAVPSIISVTMRNCWSWHFWPLMNSWDMKQFGLPDNRTRGAMPQSVATKSLAAMVPFCRTCRMQVRF